MEILLKRPDDMSYEEFCDRRKESNKKIKAYLKGSWFWKASFYDPFLKLKDPKAWFAKNLGPFNHPEKHAARLIKIKRQEAAQEARKRAKLS